MSLLSVLCISILGFPLSPQQEKVAPPQEAEVKEADKLIRDLFKDEFAKKTPADRRALAKKLLSQGRETANAPASQYSLLNLAIDLSTQAGDIETALLSMTELEKVFAMDAVAQRTTLLANLSKVAKSSEEAKSVAGGYLKLADEAMKADRFDEATKASNEALSQARKAKEVALVGAADAKAKEVQSRKGRFEKVRKAKEVLATMPDDPAANLAVGQYLCFSKGDWPTGLACLAKGPDGPLKEVALKDLLDSEIPDDIVSLADRWWEIADTAPPEDKTTMRDRAGAHYMLAFPRVAGLTKAKTEKRLAQWNGERIARGTWIDITDPSMFGQKGKPGEAIQIVHTDRATVISVESKPFPAGEYDGLSFRVRIKMERPLFSLAYRGPGYAQFMNMQISAREQPYFQIPGPNHPNPPVQMLPMTPAEEYHVAILHSGAEDAFFLNGIEIGRCPNPNPSFDSVKWFCGMGTTSVDRIRLRKR